MAAKVSAETLQRIVDMRERDHLTIDVISRRLGLGQRTIYTCISQLKAEGRISGPIRYGIYLEER